MAKFLRENRPWSRLVSLENVEIREVAYDREFALSERLHATAIRVPHRDEDSDTVAFLIRGPERRVLWLPDIDKWEKWDRSLTDLLSDPALTAFVDGTFFSADEIPGRSIAEIPHPLVPETVALLAHSRISPAGRLFFVHLNHTNRLLWDRNAMDPLAKAGLGVAAEGQRLPL
jgi:pyrroloquinoline quinone biosynthesis protein B